MYGYMVEIRGNEKMNYERNKERMRELMGNNFANCGNCVKFEKRASTREEGEGREEIMDGCRP